MRKFMSAVIFIVSIVWVGSAINGGANYLTFLIGMDMIPAKIITVLAFGVYVFVGGYMAVVWTDAIQAVLLFGGFVLIAILAIPAAGGFDNIRAAYEAAGNPGAMTAFGVGSKACSAYWLLHSLPTTAQWQARPHTCVSTPPKAPQRPARQS